MIQHELNMAPHGSIGRPTLPSHIHGQATFRWANQRLAWQCTGGRCLSQGIIIPGYEDGNHWKPKRN